MDTTLFRTKLAERIVELRESRGMTSEKLAIKIGISKSGLRYIERGMKDPRTTTLAMIATGLGYPIIDFFNFFEVK